MIDLPRLILLRPNLRPRARIPEEPAVTTPLTDARPRAAVVAELYDRHAAGLFAYCHDQLGDTTSAGHALAAVFTRVPAVEPPRAALYALARREVYRRDVAYAFPSVDPVADPPTALIERVLREVRPHQREVLLLSAVCGLDTAELSWVLDVAADTAESLVLSARTRFAQSLSHSVNSALTIHGLPPAVAEVYEALTVARPEDALSRLPWHPPPASLRTRILRGLPTAPTAETTTGHPPTATPPLAAPTPTETHPADPTTSATYGADPLTSAADSHRWPTTSQWPLPLATPDPLTTVGVFPTKKLPISPPRTGHPDPAEPPAGGPTVSATSDVADVSGTSEHLPELTPPVPGRRSRHEATTEPLPKVRDTAPRPTTPPTRQRRRLLALGKPLPKPMTAVPATSPALAADTAPGTTTEPTPDPTLSAAPVLDTVADPTADTAPPLSDTTTQPRRRRKTPPPDRKVAPFSATPTPDTATAATSTPVLDTPLPDPETERPTVATAAVPTKDPVTDPPVQDSEPSLPAAETSSATDLTAAPATASDPAEDIAPDAETTAPVRTPRPARSSRGTMGPRPRQPRQHKRQKPIKIGEHHYDWLWELAGFILCVAIALTVFFAVPTIVTP